MAISAAVPSRHSRFAVFRSRAFTLLWVGQFVSTAGSALTSLAASILVFRVTGSALSVGLMLIATALPSLLVGLLAGVVVDRVSRKRVMMTADLVRAVLVALIPLLVLGAGGVHVAGGILWLYLLVALASVGTQFFEPAFSSVLPELADEQALAAAASLMQVSSFGATAVGFAASGLIASAFPIQWAFYLDAISFVFSAACIALARIPHLPPEAISSGAAVWHNLRAGASFLASSPVLRSLFIFLVPITLGFGLANSLLLPFAVRALHASSFEYGLQEGITSVGFVAGSLLLAALADRMHEGQLLALAALGMGAISAIYAGSTSIPLAIGLVMVTGFFNAPLAVARSLVMQRNTPRELRGRVFSTFFVARDLLFVVGMAAAGLADLVNVRVLFLASALVVLIAGLSALTLPGLRQDRQEWRRAVRLLRASALAPGLGTGRVPTLADLDALAGHLPALAAVPTADWQSLLTHGRVYEVGAGTRVVRQGDTGDAMYILLRGRAAVGQAGGEHDTPLALLSAGDFFGEIAALTAARRTANVVADQPSALLEVPVGVLRHLMRTPEINRLLISTMTQRLFELNMIDAPRYAAADPQALRALRTPSATPKPATPKPATPKLATPKLATPKLATPKPATLERAPRNVQPGRSAPAARRRKHR